MIIWVASYPRSGNTFFCTLLSEIYGVKPHDRYWFDNPPAYVPVDRELSFPFDAPPSYEEMVHSDKIHFLKTHDLPSEDFPAIYLVRDGRDALLSHAHYVLTYDLKIPKNEQPAMYRDTLQSLIETDDWFGGWGPNVLAWTSRTTPTAVVKFEELIKSPMECLQRSLMSVGYTQTSPGSTGVPTFDELHQMFPQFFRQGRVGSWREEMPQDLHELFWEWHGEAMVKMGYGDDPFAQPKPATDSSNNATHAVRSKALLRLRKLLKVSEADRVARQVVIDDLKQHLDASEADRVARQVVIDDLKQHLDASEADRAARQGVIDDLKRHLHASEADRAARQGVIDDLRQHLEAGAAHQAEVQDLRLRLEAAEANLQARQGVIDDLKQHLDASEADRMAQQTIVDRLGAQIEAGDADRRAKQALIEDLQRRLEGGEIERLNQQQAIDDLRGQLEASNAEGRSALVLADDLRRQLDACEADLVARQNVIDGLLLQIDELILQLRDLQSGSRT